MNEIMEKEINVEDRIHEIRKIHVIVDRDLAKIYGVETKQLMQQVRRNIERFSERYMFQMTDEEFREWKSHFVTSNSDKMGLRRPPYCFTEQGVALFYPSRYRLCYAICESNGKVNKFLFWLFNLLIVLVLVLIGLGMI